MYYMLRENVGPSFRVDLSDICSAPRLIIRYFCYDSFFVTYIYRTATVDIETNSLEKLLEEVAEIDLLGDHKILAKNCPES